MVAEPDDVLVMVHLRNSFYKRKFHLALAIYALSLVVVVILIGTLIYVMKTRVHPLYFVTDELGRLIVDVPVDRPNMSAEDVMKYVTDAVEQSYSYDYVNYRAELQEAQKYFTDYGWRNYMKGLTESSNLVGLTQRKLISIAKIASPPKLISQGLLGGAYAWKFEIPLLVTYMAPPYNDKSQYSNPLLVTVVVQRQSVLTSYKGLGIVQMIGSLILNSPS